MSKRTGTYTTGRNRIAPMWKRHERDMYWRHKSGYCEHGVYVGGCGIDWMCGRCESGEEPLTKAERKKYNRQRKANYQLNRVLYFLKRHRWTEAEKAFTKAYGTYAPLYKTERGQEVFKVFLAYAKAHDIFNKQEMV